MRIEISIFACLVLALPNISVRAQAPRELLLDEMRTRPTLTASTVTELLERDQLCYKDRILIAPDGRTISLWVGQSRYTYDARRVVRSLPDRVNVVSLTDDKANTFSSSLALDPIGWGLASEEFRVLLAGRLAVSINIDSEEFRGFRLPENIFQLARSSSNSLLSADSLRDQFLALEKFSNYEKASSDRLFNFLGHHAIGLKFNTADEKLELSEGLINSSKPGSLFALRDLKLLEDEGEVSFVGYGENAHPLDRTEPYLTSLFDKAAGKRSGLFGPKELFVFTEDGTEIGFEANPNEVILDVDQVADKYAILLLDLDRRERVLHGSLGDLKEFITCPSARQWPPGIPPFVSQYDNVDVGRHAVDLHDTKHDIAYVRFRSKNPQPGRVTVVFHGGPLSTTLDPGIPADGIPSRYACGDVIVVDGTGTVGGGLTNSSNAAQLGFEAFRRDAVAVRELTRKLGYDSVSIIGNSFGGINGAAASIIDWPELKTISLVAPALQMLPPERTNLKRVSDFSVEFVNANGLSGFQNFVFGQQLDDVNMAMAYFLADPDNRVHVYLGTEDEQVPFDLMPRDFPKNQLTVIDGASHTSIFRRGDVSEAVRKRICGLD